MLYLYNAFVICLLVFSQLNYYKDVASFFKIVTSVRYEKGAVGMASSMPCFSSLPSILASSCWCLLDACYLSVNAPSVTPQSSTHQVLSMPPSRPTFLPVGPRHLLPVLELGAFSSPLSYSCSALYCALTVLFPKLASLLLTVQHSGRRDWTLHRGRWISFLPPQHSCTLEQVNKQSVFQYPHGKWRS